MPVRLVRRRFSAWKWIFIDYFIVQGVDSSSRTHTARIQSQNWLSVTQKRGSRSPTDQKRAVKKMRIEFFYTDTLADGLSWAALHLCSLVRFIIFILLYFHFQAFEWFIFAEMNPLRQGNRIKSFPPIVTQIFLTYRIIKPSKNNRCTTIKYCDGYWFMQIKQSTNIIKLKYLHFQIRQL